MTLSMIFGLTGYLGLRIYQIETTNEYSYEKIDLYYSDEQMNELEITLMEPM